MKTKEEVFQFLKEHSKPYCKEDKFKNKFQDYYNDLISWDFPENFTFQQKLYHYFMNDPDLKLGLCPTCGNRCKLNSFNKGYYLHCSRKCQNSDEQFKEKIKQTNFKKYGKEYYSQTEECKKKVSITCFKKYGCKNYTQSEEFKLKAKETCLEKYGNEYYSKTKDCKEKIKQTNIEKYGVENYSKTKYFHKKIKEICLKKYGKTNPFQVDEFKKKSKETCLERYGKEYYSQTEKSKERMKITCLERYGKEYYSQTEDFTLKKQKKYQYSDIQFDSSWEVKVYQYCKENNIPCEYQPDITFEYEYDGKKHYYHPDFLINGKLYEVKGEQFFEGDKMICPYNRNEYKDGLTEAKHQCMIKNGVIILRKNDIKNIKGRIF